MRLVCPSCEAKYEVPDDAIPETGRDVQCANCGHAWFQMRPRSAAPVEAPAPSVTPAPAVAPQAPVPATAAEKALANEASVEAAQPAMPEPAPAPEEEIAPEPAVAEVASEEVEAAVDATGAAEPEVAPSDDTTPEPVPEAEPEVAASTEMPEDNSTAVDETVVDETGDADKMAVTAVSDAGEAADGAAADGATAAAPAPYAVDDSVLAILREEAEREVAARAAEAQRLETQPDLGVDAVPPPKAKPALEVVSDATAALEADATDAANGLKPSARRDLLPDVEEINSTLRPSEVSSDDDGAAAPSALAASSGGFRSGFLSVMTIAIIGAVLYIAAPTLSRLVPATADALTAYVGAVDSLRLSLDGMMQSATLAINGQ